MTVLDERPTNGHAHPELALPTQHLDPRDNAPPSDSPPAAEQVESETGRAAELRQLLDERTAERDLAAQLVQVDAETREAEVRTEAERAADREVYQEIRAKQRTDTRRAGFAGVRRARWQRFQARLDERAERVRERILDPARTIGADYRRWMATSIVLFSLLGGAAAFMARTAHHGLVGVNGTWLAYLVEPLASVVLVLSMLAQFTARQRGIPVPKGFIVLDVALAAASLLLMTVPWGMRFGWEAMTISGHMLLPGLVVVCVTVWHLSSGIYSRAIANTKHDPALEERLALLRTATASGALLADVTPRQIEKYLRKQLGSISHEAARATARSFLGR